MIYILVILCVFACSASQLWLKRSAISRDTGLLASMFRWRVILPYAIFGCAVLVNIAALGSGVSLKQLPVLESLGYVFVPALACLFLGEQISRRDLLAILLILFGVIIFHI